MKLRTSILIIILLLSLGFMGGIAQAQEPDPAPVGELTPAPVGELTPAPVETKAPVETATSTPTETPFPIPTQTPWIVIITAQPVDAEPPSLAVPIAKVGEPGEPLDLLKSYSESIYGWLPWLAKQQRAYLEMTGRYAQMLPSHMKPPADGLTSIPDGWFGHPTDQQYGWPDLKAIKFEELPFVVRIDVYDGPEGQGYVACFQAQLKGELYERCENYGPESSREYDWQPVEKAEQ